MSVDKLQRDLMTHARRRRRQRRLAVLGSVAAVVLVAAGTALVVGSDSSPDVAIAGEQPSAQAEPGTPTPEEPEPASTALSVRMIEVHAGVDGGEDVVIVFDGPLPIAGVEYLEDINHLNAPGVAQIPHIAYTVQDPSEIRVCDDVHWFGSGTTTGSIDVLIPSQWLESGGPAHEVPQRSVPAARSDDTVDSPGKIVGCGPYNGYVQYSIWSPASDDPADIRVSAQDDPTRLVIAVRPRHG